MNLDRNFGLSNVEFNVLLEELKNGDEALFEEIFLSCFQNTCLYIKKKCSIKYDKAYDITMNTLLEFRIRLLDNKIVYGNLKFLFRQMAYHNFVKTVREKKKTENMMSSYIVDDGVLQNEDKKKQYLLERAYKKLGVGCKNLLDKFYYLGVSYEELANEEEVSNQAIRKRKERCLNKLKSLFKHQFEKHNVNYE